MAKPKVIALEEIISNKKEKIELEKKMPPNVTRLDRGLSGNIDDFHKSYGNDADLAFDILIYLSQRIDNNLFDNISFVARDFAKFTGYDISKLNRTHPDIESGLIKVESVTDNKTGREFSSVIEYVLFKMMTKAIIISKTSFYENETKDTFMGLLPIVNLTITNSSTAKKTTALNYDITINPLIKRNLFKNFNLIESKGYFNVGKGKGGGERKRMYLVLCWQAGQLANDKNYKDTFDWSVDEWIKRTSITTNVKSIAQTEPKRKKESLKRKFEIILNEGKIPFTYKFINYKPFGEEFQVQISFKKEDLVSFIHTKDGKFKSYVFNNLADLYARDNNVDLNHPTHQMLYQKWLISKDDMPIKLTAVIDAYKHYYFRELSKSDASKVLSKGLTILSN